MTKSIALVAMSFGVTSIFAQDLTSKKGEPILPEAGDYAIGIDATPFLNYAGNFFGKGGAASGVGSNVAPTWNFMNGGTNMITGKYFKDASTAYRAGIRIGYWNNTTKGELADASVTTPVVYPTLPTMKEDVMKAKTTAIGLTAGIEKRKGKTRLQGFYGADVMIWTSSAKQVYEYAQAVDPASTNNNINSIQGGVNTVSFNGGANLANAAGSTSGRILSKKVGNGLGLGVRAFIGAEYFILPKISLGGEFGWGVGFMTGGKTTTETETIGNNGTSNSKNNVTVESKNGGRFAIDTDLNNSTTGSILAPSASLRLNLHF